MALTWLLGAAGGRNRTPATLILAGVAVSAFLAAAQTYLMQQHVDTLREVYCWLLGRLATAGWHDVLLVLPYAAVTGAIVLSHRRELDVLTVGDEEAASLGPASAAQPVPAARRRVAGHRRGGLGVRADRLRRHHRAAHASGCWPGRATG